MSGLSSIFSMTAFQSTALGAGTYQSGPIAPAGEAEHVLLFVDVSAASGTTTSLTVELQTSPDGTTWTTVTRSATTPITTSSGSAMGYAETDDEYVQVVAIVAGTGTPTVTFSVKAVLL